jgi:hypothetical protein
VRGRSLPCGDSSSREMTNPARALSLLLLVGWTKAAVPADEITSLPGWDGPLPTKHYSGCARSSPA